MILFIIIILIFLALIFFNKKKVKFNESKNVIIEPEKFNFIESNIFQGKKEGYVYKKCTQGLGYYLDN